MQNSCKARNGRITIIVGRHEAPPPHALHLARPQDADEQPHAVSLRVVCDLAATRVAWAPQLTALSENNPVPRP